MPKHGEKSKEPSSVEKFIKGPIAKLWPFNHQQEAAELEAYMSRFEKCRKRVQENQHKVKAGPFSWDSIKEFTDSLRDIDGVWVGYILKLKVDILDSKPARDLVHVYFRVSVQTLEVLNELEDCLRVAGNDQLTLRLAANKFVNKKYPEALEKMEKFKAKEDPFRRFWPLYFKLCQQQISSLDKVMDLHVLLNKPPPPKPKPEAKEDHHEEPNELKEKTIEQVDAASETDVAKAKEEHQEADGDDVPMEAAENELNEKTDVAIDQKVEDADDVVAPVEELELNCVLTDEFEKYRALALTLTEKITSLPADTAIDDGEAKLVVDNLNTKIDKFTDDIANMTDHTRKCRNDIFSGRNKVSGSIKTSV